MSRFVFALLKSYSSWAFHFQLLVDDKCDLWRHMMEVFRLLIKRRIKKNILFGKSKILDLWPGLLDRLMSRLYLISGHQPVLCGSSLRKSILKAIILGDFSWSLNQQTLNNQVLFKNIIQDSLIFGLNTQILSMLQFHQTIWKLSKLYTMSPRGINFL